MNTRRSTKRSSGETSFIPSHGPCKLRLALERTEILKELNSISMVVTQADSIKSNKPPLVVLFRFVAQSNNQQVESKSEHSEMSSGEITPRKVEKAKKAAKTRNHKKAVEQQVKPLNEEAAAKGLARLCQVMWADGTPFFQ